MTQQPKQIFVYKNEMGEYTLSSKMLYDKGEALLATSSPTKLTAFMGALAEKDHTYTMREYACVVHYGVSILCGEDELAEGSISFNEAIEIIEALDREAKEMSSADEDGDEYFDDEDCFNEDDENQWVESIDDFAFDSFNFNRAEVRCIADALEYIANENEDLLTDAEQMFILNILDKLS